MDNRNNDTIPVRRRAQGTPTDTKSASPATAASKPATRIETRPISARSGAAAQSAAKRAASPSVRTASATTRSSTSAAKTAPIVTNRTAAGETDYRSRVRAQRTEATQTTPRTGATPTKAGVTVTVKPAAPRSTAQKAAASNYSRRRAPQSMGAGVRHKKNKRTPKWAPALISVCMIALLGVGYVGWNEVGNYMEYLDKCKQLEQDTFYSGVTLEGEPLSGLTLFDAMDKYTKQLNNASSSTNITITALGKTYTIDSSAVQLNANLQATLSLAYATGRSGSFEERYAKMQQIGAEGLDFKLDRGWNEDSLRAKIDEIASAVYVKAQNASVADFDTDSGKFTFASEVTGYQLDTNDLYQQVTSAIENGQVSANIEAKVTTIAPKYDVEYMKAHYGRISAATTTATSNSDRNTNIRLASQQFNGMVVQPGETVSFNETTGERTAEKGYKAANAYSSGVVVMELGGGVCQVSTTLYNAVCKADLEVLERSPHSRVSNYVDIGLDAAVNWPTQDFKFKNTSEFPIYIVSEFYDKKLSFKIYGKQMDDGVYIKLSSEKTETIEPKEGTRTINDSTIPAGTQKTEEAREGARAVSYKNYYTENGDLIKSVKLANSTYPSSQYTVRIGTGS